MFFVGVCLYGFEDFEDIFMIYWRGIIWGFFYVCLFCDKLYYFVIVLW